MRKTTYAYNSIILGFFIGLWVLVSSKSTVLGIAAGLAMAVIGFFIIRMFENAADRVSSKAAEKVEEAWQRRKERKAIENGSYVKPATTQMPMKQTTQFPSSTSEQNTKRCPTCGAVLKREAKFCPACGSAADE